MRMLKLLLPYVAAWRSFFGSTHAGLLIILLYVLVAQPCSPGARHDDRGR